MKHTASRGGRKGIKLSATLFVTKCFKQYTDESTTLHKCYLISSYHSTVIAFEQEHILFCYQKSSESGETETVSHKYYDKSAMQRATEIPMFCFHTVLFWSWQYLVYCSNTSSFSIIIGNRQTDRQTQTEYSNPMLCL